MRDWGIKSLGAAVQQGDRFDSGHSEALCDENAVGVIKPLYL
jgi:hypothetical protein